MSTHVVTPESGIIPISDEQIRTIETGRNRLLERAESLIICDADTEAIGWAIINGIADLEKAIVEDFSVSKKAAHAAWKAICAQENGHMEKLVEPSRIVRGKLATWDAEKKRIQAEAERKQRIEQEAERRRLQAIADEAAKVEQERRRKEAEEKRIQEAIEAEKAGKSDVAAAILEKPIEVAPVVAAAVVIPPSVVPSIAAQKVEGAGAMVEEWDYRITNAELIPKAYWLVNEKAIKKVVESLHKVAESAIPGIEVTSRMAPRISGRKQS